MGEQGYKRGLNKYIPLYINVSTIPKNKINKEALCDEKNDEFNKTFQIQGITSGVRH
jgi:hypothetical protein